MIKKVHAILCDNLIIYNNICDNFKSLGSFIYIGKNWQDFMKSSPKIDLLIINKKINPNLIPCHKINTLVNLTSESFSEYEIKLSKPCKLIDLLDLISKNLKEESIFISINDRLIYNERLASLNSLDKTIKLTEKENKIFKSLLTSKGYKLEKDQLRHEVWHYHQDSESTTIDTHLYKLKQKLPDKLLEIKNNIYSLKIEKIN